MIRGRKGKSHMKTTHMLLSLMSRIPPISEKKEDGGGGGGCGISGDL